MARNGTRRLTRKMGWHVWRVLEAASVFASTCTWHVAPLRAREAVAGRWGATGGGLTGIVATSMTLSSAQRSCTSVGASFSLPHWGASGCLDGRGARDASRAARCAADRAELRATSVANRTRSSSSASAAARRVRREEILELAPPVVPPLASVAAERLDAKARKRLVVSSGEWNFSLFEVSTVLADARLEISEAVTAEAPPAIWSTMAGSEPSGLSDTWNEGLPDPSIARIDDRLTISRLGGGALMAASVAVAADLLAAAVAFHMGGSATTVSFSSTDCGINSFTSIGRSIGGGPTECMTWRRCAAQRRASAFSSSERSAVSDTISISQPTIDFEFVPAGGRQQPARAKNRGEDVRYTHQKHMKFYHFTCT